MVNVIKVEDCGENIGDYDVLFHEAIIIPENATNGDMIKAMFPNALRSDYIENDMITIYLQDKNESEMIVPEDWWFAPYKVEGEAISYMTVEYKGRKENEE